MVLCIIPPNFRPIAEILNELERQRRLGRIDDAWNDDNTRHIISD